MKPIPTSFDQQAIGANLTLTSGNTILMTSVAGTDAHRCARSEFAQTKDTSTVEFYLYSPDASNPSLAPVGGVPPMIFGALFASGSLSKYVGEDANGIGYCPGDGKVYQNGTPIAGAAFATCPYNTYVLMLINFVTNTLTFFSKTLTGFVTRLGSVSIPANSPVWYAGTVSGNPNSMALWANGGQSPQYTNQSPGGWYHKQIGIAPLFLGTESYISFPTDQIPNWIYQGNISREKSNIHTITSAKFSVWGASAPSQIKNGNQIQFLIEDPKGIFNELLTADIRDQMCIIGRVPQFGSMTAYESGAIGIIDRCEKTTDQTKTLYCSDKTVLMQNQLYRAMFAPNADPAVAGKARPVTMGIGRTIDGAQFDSINLDRAVSDSPITGVGKARAQGVQQAYGIDYNILPDQQGFTMAKPPAGKYTFEITTFGGAFNPTFADILGGDGVFGSCADDGGGVTATGTAAVTIGTGSKAFTVSSGLSFANGSAMSWSGNVGTMTGTVTSYSGTTLTCNITSVTGSGTSSGSWSINGGVNQPHNWICGGGYPTAPAASIFQVRGTAPNQYIQQENTADAVFTAQHKTVTIAPGQSVAFQVTVIMAPWFGPASDGSGQPVQVPPAEFAFSGWGNSDMAAFSSCQWAHFGINKAGTFQGAFTNNYNATLPLSFAYLCNSLIEGSGGTFSFLQISSIKLAALPSLAANVTLDGPGLNDILKMAMIDHGPYSGSDYDQTGALAIDAVTGYKFGIHVPSNSSPQVGAVVQQIVDSVGGAVYQQDDGTLNAIQQTIPENVPAANLAGYLYVGDLLDNLQIWPDLAEGLTTRLSGCPNVNPYVPSDWTGISQQDVPQSVRQILEQPFQWTVVANAKLAPRYHAAYNAAPIKSCLDRQADGQAAINAICAPYTVDRNFYVGKWTEPQGRHYKIGQVYNVTNAYVPGLENGRNLIIYAIERDQAEQNAILVFWGL